VRYGAGTVYQFRFNPLSSFRVSLRVVGPFSFYVFFCLGLIFFLEKPFFFMFGPKRDLGFCRQLKTRRGFFLMGNLLHPVRCRFLPSIHCEIRGGAGYHGSAYFIVLPHLSFFVLRWGRGEFVGLPDGRFLVSRCPYPDRPAALGYCLAPSTAALPFSTPRVTFGHSDGYFPPCTDTLAFLDNFVCPSSSPPSLLESAFLSSGLWVWPFLRFCYLIFPLPPTPSSEPPNRFELSPLSRVRLPTPFYLPSFFLSFLGDPLHCLVIHRQLPVSPPPPFKRTFRTASVGF